jgi:hypothetical protein
MLTGPAAPMIVSLLVVLLSFLDLILFLGAPRNSPLYPVPVQKLNTSP